MSKEKVYYLENSEIRVLNLKNEVSEICFAGEANKNVKNKKSLTVSDDCQLVVFNNKKNENKKIKKVVFRKSRNCKKQFKIPDNYELLPKKYFKYKKVPLPLVSKEWLKTVYEKSESNEDKISSIKESEEDSIPLARLKIMLKTFKGNNVENNSKLSLPNIKIDDVFYSKSFQNLKKKIESDKNVPPKMDKSTTQKTCNKSIIFRKRGRPKNSEKELENKNVIIDVENNLVNSEINFSENSMDFVKIDNSLQPITSEESNLKSNKNKTININKNEHDYFKSVKENEVFETKNYKMNQNVNAMVDDIVDMNDDENEINSGGFLVSEDNSLYYPCLDCGKSFSAASTLKNHKRIHDGTLLKCTECQKGFTTKYLLKCHMRIHNGDLFKCKKCDKGFITAELLKVHSRFHTGERPFICSICGKSFPSASNLSQHKQTHNSEKRFLCFQCGSSFSQKRCLDGHMLTHSEKKNYVCFVCGKLWARKSDLKEHMRVHTGVKPYCCSICSQKFTQTSSLKRHKMVHMNISPVQCSICNKMFKCQEYYKRHLKKHDKKN